MPELPEVETMVRGIRPVVDGLRLVRLRSCPCRCRPLSVSPSVRAIARRLKGKRVETVRRRGKRVLLEFEREWILAIEPRMTGLMLLADPPDTSHLRLEWTFAKEADRREQGKEQGKQSAPLPGSGGTAPVAQPGPEELRTVWYWDRRGLGTVRLYNREEFEADIESGRLGPDALELTAADWSERLRGSARVVKVLLLDQKLAAGIGNLYASEILHEAAIDPRCRGVDLTEGDIRRLAAAVRNVLEVAIREEGSTLGDATYRTVLSEPGRYQNRHQVYARAGLECLRCGTHVVERIVQQQRSTFFCAGCQQGGRGGGV